MPSWVFAFNLPQLKISEVTLVRAQGDAVMRSSKGDPVRDDSYMEQKVMSVISVRPVCRHRCELSWWRCNRRTKQRGCVICNVRKKVLDMTCGREVDEEKGSKLCWAISELHGGVIPGRSRRALFCHGEFEQVLWNYEWGWFIELNKLIQAITEEAALLWVTYARILPNSVWTCKIGRKKRKKTALREISEYG